jgi:hypothetical protein
MARKNSANPSPDGRNSGTRTGASKRVSVVHLLGRPEEKDWLTDANRKTRLPKATIVRLALAGWGVTLGLPPYPDRGGG